MPRATVNGVAVNYRQAGSGDDLLLIHGLAANHAFWRLPLLLPLAERYRVTVFDLRGHGYSETPLSGYASADLAKDIEGLMDHLQINVAHLVGHSFGGVAALHLAVLAPTRVASLTIADSRIRSLQPHQRLRDWPNWHQAQQALKESGVEIGEDEEDIGLRLLEVIASPEWRAKQEREKRRPLFLPFNGWASGNRSAAKWLKLLEMTSIRQDVQATCGLSEERIHQVQQPVMAIYGEKSRCMATCYRLQQIVDDCTTVIVPKVGHFYPVLRPAFVAEMILAFLGECDAKQSQGANELSQDVEWPVYDPKQHITAEF